LLRSFDTIRKKDKIAGGMMLEAVLQELLLAIARFFINPLLYVAIFVAVLLGYLRVKRERKFYHIRILNGWTELRSIFSIGFVLSVVLSIITIAAGLTVHVQYLMVVSFVTIICILLLNFHLLSAIFTWGIAYSILLLMKWQGIEIKLLGYHIEGLSLDDSSIVTGIFIIGLLLIAEGIIMHKEGAKIASPLLEKTNRGLKSIAFFSKKMTIIPVFFLIPSNVIDPFAPWWPYFTLGAEQFGLVLFPVVIGFQQVTRRLLPVHFYPKLGRYVRTLGVVTILGGVVAYFDERIGIIVIAVALVIRFILSVGYKLTERKDVYAVSPAKEGAMIAAVLPDSPAEKMGLVAGEIITRVNGRDVYSERELYEALQINAAYCKLEVLDFQKENRLTQYVVHSEDHHQIGLIII
jgi:hypothetical protein